MTKIGVGVGEDFPIEDKPEAPEADSPEGAGHHACRDEDWDAWRSAKRAARAEWKAAKAAWRVRKRAWREENRAAFREDRRIYGYRVRGPFAPFVIGGLLVVATIVGIFTLVAAAPFLLIAGLVLAVLWAAHDRHRACEDVPPPDYRREPPPAAPAA